MNLLIFAFILYIFVIFSLVFFAYKKTNNLSDYILGGRSSSSLLTALGAGASDMSSWLLLALPAVVLLNGLNQIWMPLSLFIGQYLNWTFIAKRLRIYTEIAQNSITIPAYFENRFHDKSHILRLLTAIVILIFFTIYTASGLISGCLLLQTIFGISYEMSLLITGLVVVSYTSIGGFLAVSWIDLFQGLLMLIALLVVPYIAVVSLGGFENSVSLVADKSFLGYLNPLHNVSIIGIISLFSWGLGYFGQPHILVRFMGMQHHQLAKQSRSICMIWMAFSLLGSIFVGLLGMVVFYDTPLANAESVFIKLSTDLMPPLMTGIMLAAVLSATMSTASAQLLASSSAIIEDIYCRWISKKSSPRSLLWFGKISVLIISLIACLLASRPDSSVLSLVSYAWAGLGSSFGPVILVSLFWKRMTLKGAIFGMLTGSFIVIIWPFLKEVHNIFQIYELLPAFLSNIMVIYLASLLSKTPSSEICIEFDQMKSILKEK